MFHYSTVILFLFSTVASVAENVKNTNNDLSGHPLVSVKIDSGTIQGSINEAGTVASFRGIPYASPPVGSLRFQKPTPPATWSGIKETIKDGAGCPQQCKLPKVACPPVTDENCLYLNVFTPIKSSPNKLPIMFWIHGGDFYQGYGGGILYDGTSIVENENVIVVAINYRLGALGFLYSGSDSKTQFTGNFGILDQQFALHWVQRNAHAFGGMLFMIYQLHRYLNFIGQCCFLKSLTKQ